MTDTVPKKTPLYEEHVGLGAKIIPFGGWLMPVQYTSIVEEHQAVRNGVGIFDISHMGQLIVEGSGARAWLNTMLTNNVDKLQDRTGQYTFLLNERSGIIDDLIVYRIDKEKFLLVVNASRTDEESASKIVARILAEWPFRDRAWSIFFTRCLAQTSIFRREITLSIFHSMKQMFRSRGPATLEKTVWKFSFGQVMRSSFGTRRSRRASRSGSSRAVLARATPCDSKCVIHSTAPICRQNEIQSRLDSGFLSI